MPTPVRRAALPFALFLALPVWADDSKTSPSSGAPHYRSAGQVIGQLEKVSGEAGGTITVKLPEVERDRNSSGGRYRTPRLHVTQKGHDFTLTDDAKVRWHELPKGADGKAKQYSNVEYQKLREPVGTPGFKADWTDLHTGQTVKLYLAKAGKDDKPVVTVVMIMAEPKSAPAKPGKDDKPKK
jgi:hypothetical protein